MALEKITTVTGRGVFIPGADIDTDRIIPARFMKCVTFDGLGEFAFHDVRFDPDTGEKTDHPLNDERFKAATILLAGVTALRGYADRNMELAAQLGAYGVEPALVFVRAQGAHVWDAEGKRYIDYHAAFAPHLLGHNHAEVNRAVE